MTADRSPAVGQTYFSARLGEGLTRIALTDVSPTSAAAVYHGTGDPLPKRIPIGQLHAHAVTGTGRRRTAGWVLDRSPEVLVTTRRPPKPWRVLLAGPEVTATSPFTSENKAFEFVRASLGKDSPAETARVEVWEDGIWRWFETMKREDMP